MAALTSVQEYRLRFRQWAQSHGMDLCSLDGSMAWRLRGGPTDAHALTQAITAVWARHDALQATYHVNAPGTSPTQEFRGDVPPAVSVVDLSASAHSSHDRAAAARALLERDSRAPRPIDRAPQVTGHILQLDYDDTIVALFHPSLMMDHWGFDLFLRDLTEYYAHLTGTAELAVRACGQFSQFARDEHRFLRDGTWDDSVEYWRRQYDGSSPLPILDLPDLGDTEAPFLSGDAVTGTLDPASVAALRPVWAAQARLGVTPYGYMLSCVLIVLGQLTGQDRLGVLVPAANRRQWEYLDTVGLFATILAPRFTHFRSGAFSELCSRVSATLIDSLEHQQISYHEMVRRLDPDRYGQPWRAAAMYFDYWNLAHHSQTAAFGQAIAEPFQFDERPSEEEGIGLVYWDDGNTVNSRLGFGRRVLTSEAAHGFLRAVEYVAVAAADDAHPDIAALAEVAREHLP